MNLYDNVKTLARRRGMTIQELAEKAGLGRNSIYKWRTQSPKADTLVKVADALGVTPNDLTGEEKNSTIKSDGTLDSALGTIMSFDGKPITNHDRKVMKDLLESYLKNKR